MTHEELRDYFAAHALASIWQHDILEAADSEHVVDELIRNASELAYQIADSMLAARAKSQPPTAP